MCSRCGLLGIKTLSDIAEICGVEKMAVCKTCFEVFKRGVGTFEGGLVEFPRFGGERWGFGGDWGIGGGRVGDGDDDDDDVR